MTTTKLHLSPADPLQEQPQASKSQSMVQARDVLLDRTLFCLKPQQAKAMA